MSLKKRLVSQINKYYFDHPEIWEEISHPRHKVESKFLMEVFQHYGNHQIKKVLDVGCGTGFHINELGQNGIDGLGIDLNKNMIDYARKKYPSENFFVQDMRRLEYESEFDALFCLCTTFAYNTTNDQIIGTLRRFHKSIRTGGIIVIDLQNMIGFIQKRKYLDRLEETYKKFNLRSVHEHQIDELHQTQTQIITFYPLDGQLPIKSDTTTLRLFFPEEFKYFLETNGFEFLSYYGKYNMGSRELDSTRMIAIARKK